MAPDILMEKLSLVVKKNDKGAIIEVISQEGEAEFNKAKEFKIAFN